ncbi:MAG: ethanolamine utilization microcompartment protein EutL [Planctomycetes bacterium]|nr:ethanolamine utilization microcompartment protein EutL [Planctomycetota bacterium]
MVLEPVRPTVLATRFIPAAPRDLLQAYGFSEADHGSLGLVTCDQDDALYVALDEATKQAPVDVVFGQSFWAGSAHASGPFSGECLGIIAGPGPDEVRAGLEACARSLEQDPCFYRADEAGKLLIFPHVVHAIGHYLAKESGLPPGAPMAYLIAPPLEAVLGLDAALKAAEVRLQKSFAPPTPTNFSGGYLAGDLEQCQAAAVAFAEAIVRFARAPRAV